MGKRKQPPEKPAVQEDPADDPLVVSFERVEKESSLTAHDLRIRLFLRYYVQSYSARGAAISMGIPKEQAAHIGHKYLHHPKTQELLREMLRDMGKETELLRQEVLTMLLREANHDDGSPGAHGARVNALRQLTKVLGMESTTVNTNNKHEGPAPVLAVPLAGSPEDWSRMAAESQGALLSGDDSQTAELPQKEEMDESVL